MNRITAGDAVSMTFPVAASGETHTAFVTDAMNRKLRATAEVSGTDVIVALNESDWHNGQGGYGFVQVKRGGVTVLRERVRILPGIDAHQRYGHSDYGVC